jgi:hypothetical protein
MQQFDLNAGPHRLAALFRPRRVPMLQSMRQVSEFRGRKCMEDGDEENTGRDQIERFEGDTLPQRGCESGVDA